MSSSKNGDQIDAPRGDQGNITTYHPNSQSDDDDDIPSLRYPLKSLLSKRRHKCSDGDS